MSAPEILRKITVRDVIGGTPEAPKDGAKTELMKVWGSCADVSVLTNDKGEYARFRGRFQAMDPKTGELFESAKLILPEPAAGMLYAALASADGATVNFAFSVGVKGDKTSVTKYQYTASPLLDSGEADPMALIAEQAGIKTGAALTDQSDSKDDGQSEASGK